MKKNTKFLFGVGAGACLGLLFAPKKGSDSRKILKEKCSVLYEKLKHIDPDEVKDSIAEKLTELQNELKDLDKEKVKAIAVKKAKDIKSKADELFKIAVEKSTPAIQKTAKEVRASAAKLLNDLSEKIDVKETK